jgi:hypothetical protein
MTVRSPSTDSRPQLRVLAAVGLIAGTTLGLQVLLTRVFAAALFYHFGFLAISLALLGVGAGAIAIYVRPDWFDRLPVERAMARLALAYGALLLVAVIGIVRLDYSYDGIEAGFVFNLAVACVLAALPFLAAGIAIALAVRAYTSQMGRLYAFDLAGAGIGALAVVPLMWLVPAPVLVAALAALAALAAALLAPGRAPERTAGLAGLAAVALMLVLSGPFGLFYLDPQGRDPDADRWTPLSRVLGYKPAQGTRDGLVAYDRVSGEIIPYSGGPYPGWRRLKLGPQSIGYELTEPGRVLVIGGGGGRDILNALSSGQRRVDVIELNRGIREVVDDDLAELSGRPYSLPGVSTVIGDGRSTLAARDTRYDQVHIGFTDTFSASSAQAFALTENNLYTVEAFDEYLDHLRPRGVLSVSRPIRHLGAEGLRATVLTLEALRRRGIENPLDHMLVVRGRYRAFFKVLPFVTVLARLEPYTPGEVARVRRLAGARGRGVAMAPGGPYYREWGALARASSLREFCEGYQLDVCPPTDDRPFFFQMTRLGDIGETRSARALGLPDPLLVLGITFAILLALASVTLALPLAFVARRERPSAGSLGFFALIGLGFLLLEVVLIQRFVLFLGFPTYALSVVLFTLLIFTGVGSLLSARAEREPRRALVAALASACLLVAAGAFLLGPLLRALIELPFGARLVLAVVMLAPLGVLLGMAMPIGLRRLAGLYPAGVAWAWGVNGITSVLGSVLAILIAIGFGFTVTTLAGLACYLGALVHALAAPWPEPQHPERGEAPRTRAKAPA